MLVKVPVLLRAYAQVPLPVMPTRAIPPTVPLVFESVMCVMPEPLPMNVLRAMV